MRLRVVLVWLLLALLPVRGWATLVMQLQPPGSHGASAHLAQPPCHEIATAAPSLDVVDVVDVVDASTTGGISSHAGCSMCDLCHSAAACNALPTPSAVLDSVAGVKPLADADTGRALVGGLERPPRHPLG